MENATAEKILSNANAVAHRYRKRAPWSSFEDVRQAAAVEMIDAERKAKYDPQRGVEVGAYFWRIGVYGARREVHLSRSPVSHLHRVERLRDIRGESMYRPSDTGEDTSEERTELGEGQECIDATAHRMQIAQRVRERISAVLGESWVDLVLGVLGEGWTPAEVAEKNGVEVTQVYVLIRKATAALTADRALFALWSNQ